ncbi:hypothetical protein CUZ56_00249 [Saezia sanguinis]|uniref:Uncharacterized protein n=1 Tax=Saezia sanguinis TaxID=1965230 RepID=A0A433SGD5_9BURK|nr:hypothetical protein [Saezia sanguinis]RUS67772.1 hypothetical protein CUZ56_00249 [Saezia sanguinis]
MNNSSPILLIETQLSEETGEHMKIVLPANVGLDLRNIKNDILLDEMRKRGYFLSVYDPEDINHTKFIKETIIRVFEVLTLFEARDISKASEKLGVLVDDVLNRFLHRNAA